MVVVYMQMSIMKLMVTATDVGTVVDNDSDDDENEIAGCQDVITMRQRLMTMVVVHMQMSITIVMVTVYQM